MPTARARRPRPGRGGASGILVGALLLAGVLWSTAARSEPTEDAGTVPVDVVSHGWHTGIVIPITPAVVERCPPLQEFSRYRTVEIGWGDEGFYRAESIGLGVTVRAIAWPTPSVVHVVGLRFPTEEEFERADVVRIELPAARFHALVDSIASDFDAMESFADGRYGPSRFFRGRLPYRFPRTCNAWTLRKLADAGCATAPFFGLRAEVAMHQVARSGTVIRLAPREGKWPYGLGALAGAVWMFGRRRRPGSAEGEAESRDDDVREDDSEESESAHSRSAHSQSAESGVSDDPVESPPPASPGPLHAWLVVVGSMLAMLVATVLAANGHAWGSTASRGALVVMTGAFVVAALRSALRWREERPRATWGRGARLGVSLLVATLATAVILSPM